MRRPRENRTPPFPHKVARAPVRIFGVIVPVPASLSRRADRVRRLYDPNFPHIGPHVTVLPPRALSHSRRQVLEAVARVAARTAPFSLWLGKVDTFRPVMPVIYLGFRRGAEDLHRLHRRLARDPLSAPESFPYVPHLTLGQDLGTERMKDALLLSRKLFPAAGKRWQWAADSLVVVERTSSRRWISLAPLSLALTAGVRSRPAGRRHP